MSHLIITGATGGQTQGAAAPNRLEINDFIKNQDQFSLYVQALTRMYTTSQTNPLSHFAISGIHGLPYVQWEGAGGNRPVQGSQWGGYCTHGSVLFPTWHRPFWPYTRSQVLQQHALDIAKTYQDQRRWVGAAQNLRAPYWDWAIKTVPPPEVISLETVDIITPDGKTTNVPNPLLKYTFKPVDSSFPNPWRSWKTTIRHPDNPRSPNAATDVQGLRDNLASIQGDITSSTYRLLTLVRTWPAFSNHTVGDGDTSSNSLEAIHDKIHAIVGGNMAYPAIAGFDPIFYLHHCNVDRMLSLWSAVNPGVWVSSGPAQGGTFTIPGNATIDDKTNLTPFWNSQTGFWASSGTTATTNLNYTYPEFNNLDLGNVGAVQLAIGNYINRTYGGGQFSLPRRIVPSVNLLAQPPAKDDAPAPVAQVAPKVTAAVSSVKSAAENIAHDVHERVNPSHTTEPEEHEKIPPSSIYDWTARIHAKKYELGDGYMVLIFLGNVPEDPALWCTSTSFVGVHVAFVNSEVEQCANCREQAEIVIEGFVHLNSAIAKVSGLSSYDPSVVGPYLRENLHWRVQAADRSPIDLERLPSLEITAVSNVLTHEPGSLFPISRHREFHHHITHGRLGGARRAHA
ncbi:photo-regulated tyrosinase [Russula earlei]|uniref:Photo-regulated tyrosinase n=1 Tax=Russula earlei TaxID=71964 RepID=A0ACC0UCN6_9AGAM|nr:photo-regulated tyrosinase [Russula earlei]